MNLDELIAQTRREREAALKVKARAVGAVQAVLSGARAAGRDQLTAAEDARVEPLIRARDAAVAQIQEIDGRLERAVRVQAEEAEMDSRLGQVRPSGVDSTRAYDRVTRIGERVEDSAGGPRTRWVRSDDPSKGAANIARGQRFADHPTVAAAAAARHDADEAIISRHGSLGYLLRAMTTTSGSAVVPQVWAGDIIDRARALSAVLQAGAEIVPMPAKVVNIGRLTTDPVAAFRAEGSPITASDPVFDSVVLDSKTMSALVVGSLEWFMDADNIDEVVSDAIAQAVAAELDRQALFGGVVAGGETGATGFNTTFPTPPNPRGVLATLLAVAASSVLGSGANGTAQTAATFWREVQTTIFTVMGFNEFPNALIWNSRLAQQYTDAYDTTNQPLRMPENIAELPRFVSNQIPTFTQGTMVTRATDLFVGNFEMLLIGQRLDFTVQTLTERYAENGQIGIVAHWRGDVAPARPRAFSVFRYLQAAA